MSGQFAIAGSLFWSPLPLHRERVRVRVISSIERLPKSQITLTPALARSTGRGRKCGVCSALAMYLITLLLVGGCAQPAGPLFPPPKEAIRWPAPPEPARVQYVGQLTGSKDLKPSVSAFKNFGRTVFGEEPTQ